MMQPRADDSGTTFLICALAWAVPGAGHLWLGRMRTGLILFAALSSMFAVGLWLGGQIFSFDLSDPLVALAALADLMIGGPYFVARGSGWATVGSSRRRSSTAIRFWSPPGS